MNLKIYLLLKIAFFELLSKLNGIGVLKEIRISEMTRLVPVIIVIPSREYSYVKRAYELGTNCYVVKSVSLESFFDVKRNLGFYWLLINKAVD